VTLTTSAVALTEFLGGAPRPQRGDADWIASRFLVGGVTEATARRAATLMRAALDLAPTAAPGAVDATVVAEAERRGADVVISGDRNDFEALEAASGRVRIIDIDDLIE
jgi:hypothetical protein